MFGGGSTGGCGVVMGIGCSVNGVGSGYGALVVNLVYLSLF